MTRHHQVVTFVMLAFVGAIGLAIATLPEMDRPRAAGWGALLAVFLVGRVLVDAVSRASFEPARFRPRGSFRPNDGGRG